MAPLYNSKSFRPTKSFSCNISYVLTAAMEGCRRKLKCLSIPEKVKVIKAVDHKDKSKQEIAKEFDIPVSTLSTILKKKNEILTRFRIGDCTRKRKREAELPSVEKLQ